MLKNVELTGKKKKMIAALMTCRTIGEAVQMAGVTRTTLSRWLNDPEFSKALTAAENETMRESSRVLLTGQREALKTIFELMINGESDAIKLRAAAEWLSQSFKWRELITLDERMTAIEERLANK